MASLTHPSQPGHGRGRHRAGRRFGAPSRPKQAGENDRSENGDLQAGINIVLKALETPIRQIVENAGVEGSIVVGKVLENKSETFGFDAQSEEYVDMVAAGIIDPTKVASRAPSGCRFGGGPDRHHCGDARRASEEGDMDY